MSYLIQLLRKYVNDNKVADQEFVMLAIDYLVQEKNLYNNVKRVEFNDYKNTSYNEIEQKINFNIEMHRDFILNQFQHLMKEKTKEEYIMIINFSIFTAIFHEIEHVLQFKYLNNNNNELESYLIHIAFKWSHYKTDLYKHRSIDYQNRFYNYLQKSINTYSHQKVYYLCNPAERIAYIKSNKKTLETINQINDLNLSLAKDIFTTLTLLYEIDQYQLKGKKIICPLNIYMKKRNKILKKHKLISSNYFKQVINMHQSLSLDDKLLYGLPITLEEYSEQLDIIYAHKAYQLRRV